MAATERTAATLPDLKSADTTAKTLTVRNVPLDYNESDIVKSFQSGGKLSVLMWKGTVGKLCHVCWAGRLATGCAPKVYTTTLLSTTQPNPTPKLLQTLAMTAGFHRHPHSYSHPPRHCTPMAPLPLLPDTTFTVASHHPLHSSAAMVTSTMDRSPTVRLSSKSLHFL